MKRSTATAILLFIGILCWAQDDSIDDIGISLRNGSARELVKFCGSSVILKLDGQTSTYSRSDAEKKLRSFFLNNPPVDFNYIHQGSSNEGLRYCIGKYKVNNGEFRVVLLLKEEAQGYELDTITLTEL